MNEVEIVVKSKDKTKGGFNSAKAEARALQKELAKVDGELGTLGDDYDPDALAKGNERVRLSFRETGGALDGAASSFARFAAKSAAMTLVGTAAAGAVGPVLSLASALGAAAVGTAAALPAFAVAAAGAVGTLKIAVSGLGDALGAVAEGDTEAFNESLKKLSPAARGVAQEVRGLWPQIDQLKRTVQESVFSRFTGETAALGRTWLPLLQDRLAGIGAAWGVAFKNAAQAARSQTAVAGVTAALDQTHFALAAVNDAVGPLLTGFGALVGAAAPLIGQAGGGFAKLATDFGQFLQQAAASGQLAAFLETVKATLADLGGIALQAGGIIKAVLDAANASGGGLLNNLRQLLTAVNAFLSSAQGQAALNTIFATTAQVLGILLPVAGQLAGSFAQLLIAVLPMVPPLAQLAAVLAGGLAAALSFIAGLVQRFQGWLVPLAAGILAVAAAIKVWQIATAAYTAVQAALNIVMVANPIGIVIVAIIALVAILVVAWKRSETFRNVVKGALHAVAAAGVALWHAFQAVGRFMTAMFNRLASAVLSAARRGFLGPIPWIIANWRKVLSFFTGLPGRIRGALAGAGQWLLQAGRNIINGLVRGIQERVHAVTSAISSVASKIRNFLPFSPAKEGPLSGRGDPYISGKRIAQNLARGMAAGVDGVAAAAGKVTAGVHPGGQLAGLGRSAPTGPAAAAVRLEIASGGSRLDDVLVEVLRKAIRARGGNVQAALGS